MAARLGQDAPMSTKRDDVFARIDAANAADPHLEAGEPVELLYGQRMTAEQLAQEGGGKPPVFPLTVTLRLPGDTEGDTRSWSFEVGDGKRVRRDLAAISEHGSPLPVVLGVGGAMALLAAALLALTPARNARSRRRQRSASVGR